MLRWVGFDFGSERLNLIYFLFEVDIDLLEHIETLDCPQSV